MKLFRKETNYAVRALVRLAQMNIARKIQEESGFLPPQTQQKRQATDFVSTSQLAKDTGIPKMSLRGIVTKLVSAGILMSTDGYAGGMAFALSPGKITVHDIILALHGELIICDTDHDKELCSNYETCVIRKKIMKIENIIKTEFHKITIQSLVIEMT